MTSTNEDSKPSGRTGGAEPARLDAYVAKRLRLLRQTPPESRSSATRALAASQDPRDLLALICALDAQSEQIRGLAARALADRGGSLGRVAVRALFGDPNACNRSDAAEALTEVGKRADERRLLLALRDLHWSVRSSAADALGQIGGCRAREALIRYGLHDRHPVVRRDAAEALGALRDRRAVPALLEGLARENEPRARAGYLFALFCLGEADRLSELAELLALDDMLVVDNVLNSFVFRRFEDRMSEAQRQEWIDRLKALLARTTHPAVVWSAEQLLGQLTNEETWAQNGSGSQ